MMGSQIYKLNGYWHEIDTEGKITAREIFYILSGTFYDRVDLSKKYTIVVNDGEISINKDGEDILISIEESKDNKKLMTGILLTKIRQYIKNVKNKEKFYQIEYLYFERIRAKV